MVMAAPMISDPVLTLGERLAKARKDARLDQQQIAEQLGVSRPTVSHWERNRSEPNVTHAARWAEITGVSFGWLAGVAIRSRCSSAFALVTNAGYVQTTLAFDRPVLTPV